MHLALDQCRIPIHLLALLIVIILTELNSSVVNLDICGRNSRICPQNAPFIRHIHKILTEISNFVASMHHFYSDIPILHNWLLKLVDIMRHISSLPPEWGSNANRT